MAFCNILITYNFVDISCYFVAWSLNLIFQSFNLIRVSDQLIFWSWDEIMSSLQNNVFFSHHTISISCHWIFVAIYEVFFSYQAIAASVYRISFPYYLVFPSVNQICVFLLGKNWPVGEESLPSFLSFFHFIDGVIFSLLIKDIIVQSYVKIEWVLSIILMTFGISYLWMLFRCFWLSLVVVNFFVLRSLDLLGAIKSQLILIGDGNLVKNDRNVPDLYNLGRVAKRK